MRALAAAAALWALATASGCVHWRLDWTRPDGSGDDRQLASDIAACEEYTRIAEDDHPFQRGRGARAYGGWGSFPFEFCMNQRCWVLTRVPADPGG